MKCWHIRGKSDKSDNGWMTIYFGLKKSDAMIVYKRCCDGPFFIDVQLIFDKEIVSESIAGATITW